jgi:CubicO group peptidase (beta-lactamase class C family)
MKKTIVSFLIGVAATLPACTQHLPASLDTLMDAYVKVYGFNGTVFAATKGAVIFEKGYGYKNKVTNARNDTNTIFQIGSITKQFTSAIILQLLEQNKLSLQDSLTKYIPDYPNGNKITIEELLTHTAGVYNYTNDVNFMVNETTHPINRDSLINRFKHKPLDFQPGQKFSYSNSGYILLGYIIEKVTGQSYFQVVRQRIFQPLHMDHSGFDFTHLNSPDKAIGYTSPESTTPANIVDSSVSFAAGSIYTTVGDLYKWDRALRSGRIISPASQEKAYTPHLAQYGYGWMIGTVDGKKVVEHGGGITGFVSQIRRIPEDETCIVVLDNQPNGANPSDIARDISAILNGKDVKLPETKVATAVDTAILRQYVGVYQISPTFSIAVTLDGGRLYGQATGQGKFQLFAQKKDNFFLKVVQAEVEFVRGADDKVEKLILHQNGQNISGKRL